MKIKITGESVVPTWYSNKIGEVFEVAEVAENGDVRVKNENEFNSMWVFKGSFEEVKEVTEKKYMRFDMQLLDNKEFNIKNIEHSVETLEEVKQWFIDYINENYEDDYEDDEDYEAHIKKIEEADAKWLEEYLYPYEYGIVEIDEDGNGFLE